MNELNKYMKKGIQFSRLNYAHTHIIHSYFELVHSLDKLIFFIALRCV